MIVTIITFIIILSIIVFVHELGHFVMAKKAGIRVDEFGFGFPPRIFGIKKGETIYSLNLLPIGGFVKIHGEDGKKGNDPDKERAFYSKPAWIRSIILIAGVAMNFLLAAILFSAAYWIGLPAAIDGDIVGDVSREKIQIVEVAENSPALTAGIKIGDTINSFKINGETFSFLKISEIQNFISQHKGEEMTFVINRGDETIEEKIIPRENYPENEGPLGIGMVKTGLLSYPWYKALYKGFVTTVKLTGFIAVALATIIWQLITEGSLAMEIAGPVGIFNLTGDAAKLGLIYVIQLAAILNIHLAIINILPFPALDGGRLLFIGIEKIKGSPVSGKVEGMIHLAGFIVLILLLVAITWHDIVKLF